MKKKIYQKLYKAAEEIDKANSLVRYGDSGMIKPDMVAHLREIIALAESGLLEETSNPDFNK